MDTAMEEYLDAINIGRTLKELIEQRLTALAFLCPADEKIAQIFVTNRVNPTRRHDSPWCSVWGFSEKYLFETRDFIIDDNADVSPYFQSISYIGIESKALVTDAPPTDASRLSVELETGVGHTYNHLSAIGVNCRYLLQIVRERFVPNIRPTEDTRRWG